MIPVTNYNILSGRLPRYTAAETRLFWTASAVLTLLLNLSLFGTRFFTDITVLLLSGLVTAIIVMFLWIVLRRIAEVAKAHFITDRYPYKRILTTMSLSIIISLMFLTIVHWAYDGTRFLNYNFEETRYRWSLILTVILNAFFILLQEGIDGFQNWKATMIETEQLKKEYMQSQLLGLKSQVNPHFLFNSLNSLSSLISEDQDEAEKFLDEMSKVYRYLLRNTDDQLVTLDTELQFVNSYFYLLKSRYSDGIQLHVAVDEAHLQMTLPPLTLQMLVEAAYNENTINRDRPLKIEITSIKNGWLQVKNNIEKKVASETSDQSGLENVANKFRLLCQQSIVIIKTAENNIIELPLIPQSEKVPA